MSSTTHDEGRARSGAERRFYEAFERLQNGSPRVVPVGTKISQNNVAKEAGTIPSALRASRFPKLVGEIRSWIDAHESDEPQMSSRQRILAQRNRNRDLRNRISELKTQRDDAMSKLVLAEARLLELTLENDRLQRPNPSRVFPIRPANQ